MFFVYLILSIITLSCIQREGTLDTSSNHSLSSHRKVHGGPAGQKRPREGLLAPSAMSTEKSSVSSPAVGLRGLYTPSAGAPRQNVLQSSRLRTPGTVLNPSKGLLRTPGSAMAGNFLSMFAAGHDICLSAYQMFAALTTAENHKQELLLWRLISSIRWPRL